MVATSSKPALTDDTRAEIDDGPGMKPAMSESGTQMKSTAKLAARNCTRTASPDSATLRTMRASHPTSRVMPMIETTG
ncbi:hypothetical protein, partial [Brevibacterium paucivorans]|uniref:hypothetical protein n=1 Tax=Brevibacterium paucivorans TaxID=170994 RepID=UPI001CA4F734